jgi:hypothetical protein
VTALKWRGEQGGPDHGYKTAPEARTLAGDEERRRRPHVHAGMGLELGESYERNQSEEGWGCSWALFIGRGGSEVDGRRRGNGGRRWSSIKIFGYMEGRWQGGRFNGVM